MGFPQSRMINPNELFKVNNGEVFSISKHQDLKEDDGQFFKDGFRRAVFAISLGKKFCYNKNCGRVTSICIT